MRQFACNALLAPIGVTLTLCLLASACDTSGTDELGELQVVGEHYSVTVVNTTPQLADTGLYTWEVLVSPLSSQGNVDELTLVVEPVMPMHGHGTEPRFTEGVASGGGVFLLEDMNLFMPGTWVLLMEVKGPAGDEELSLSVSLRG